MDLGGQKVQVPDKSLLTEGNRNDCDADFVHVIPIFVAEKFSLLAPCVCQSSTGEQNHLMRQAQYLSIDRYCT